MANFVSANTAIALGELLEPTRLLSFVQSVNPKLINQSPYDIITEYIYRTPRLPVFIWSKDINTLINIPIAPETITFSKTVTYDSIKIPGYHTSIPIYQGAEAKHITFSVIFDRSANSSFSDNGTGQILTYIPGYGCLDVIASLEKLILPMNSSRKPPEQIRVDTLTKDISSAAFMYKISDYPDPQTTEFYAETKRKVYSLDEAGVAAQSNTVFNRETNTVSKIPVARQYKFYPNPVCYFFAGIRYWKCYANFNSIEEIRYNKLMIPTHIKVSFDLTVLEEDSYYRSDATTYRSDGYYTQENLQREFFSKKGTRNSVLDIVSYTLSTIL